MNYKPINPYVTLGLVTYTLPNGQQAKIPRAFVDRMDYEIQTAGGYERGLKTAQNRQGALPTVYGAQQLLKPFQQNINRDIPTGSPRYVQYAGLPEFINQISQKYEGSGLPGTQQSTAQLQQQYILQKYNNQQHNLQPNQARQINVNPTGQVISDTGPKIQAEQLRQFDQQIAKEQKPYQEQVRKDVREFQKIGEASVVSNLPITVSKYVGGNMTAHIQKLQNI